MMGFLGVTADITGFEVEPSILMFSMLLGCVIQLMKDTAEENERDEKRRSQISK